MAYNHVCVCVSQFSVYEQCMMIVKPVMCVVIEHD